MRFRALMSGILLTTACGVDATSNQTSSSPSPDFTKAALELGNCRGTKIASLVGTKLSAEAIADQVMGDCSKAVENLTAALSKQEALSGAQKQELRAHWRDLIIQDVNQQRTGAASSDPSQAWGICVGKAIPEPIPFEGPIAPLVDKAIKACSAEEDRVRAQALQETNDPAAVERLIESQKAMASQAATMQIEQMRAAARKH